ncbi:MAG: ABC transporter ATP-binding protein [Halanaerobium sp.]|nr:ABC transporter ATP-binding protein [Halanaerobium sp.]
MSANNDESILSVENLSKIFKNGIFRPEITVAVEDVSFEMRPGTVLSLIGESGSGKTTVGKLILKLLKPTEGQIVYRGQNITTLSSRAELKRYYRKVQAIFQDPFSSFNPLYRIDRIFDMIFKSFARDETNCEERIYQVLQDVNLNPERTLHKFPHQLSGGQLQRLLIARALLMEVDILVADELISMLDASTRIGVLNLLVDLCKENGMSVLFITHDLNLGYYISDYTLIMYKGRLVEKGRTRKVYENPIHPYTRMLFESVPEIGERWDRSIEFLPEQIVNDVQGFYQNNQGRGFVEVEEEHSVLYSCG